MQYDINFICCIYFRKGRVPSVGRLREFLSKSEDQSKVEATDGSMYYNIWHNKSKILSNLKKQGLWHVIAKLGIIVFVINLILFFHSQEVFLESW